MAVPLGIGRRDIVWVNDADTFGLDETVLDHAYHPALVLKVDQKQDLCDILLVTSKSPTKQRRCLPIEPSPPYSDSHVLLKLESGSMLPRASHVVLSRRYKVPQKSLQSNRKLATMSVASFKKVKSLLNHDPESAPTVSLVGRGPATTPIKMMQNKQAVKSPLDTDPLTEHISPYRAYCSIPRTQLAHTRAIIPDALDHGRIITDNRVHMTGRRRRPSSGSCVLLLVMLAAALFIIVILACTEYLNLPNSNRPSLDPLTASSMDKPYELFGGAHGE